MKRLPVKPTITSDDLAKIDIRVGTIERVEDVAGSSKLVRPAACRLARRRGDGACTDLARQLHLCRAVTGRQAVITQIYYDIPEPGAALSDFPGIDPGGQPHSGGWDELAAVMDTRGDRRGFEAVICMSADRLSRRIPVLVAREGFARRCGTPILCADELTMPGQLRSITRQLRSWPFTLPAPTGQAVEGVLGRALSMTGSARQPGGPAARWCGARKRGLMTTADRRDQADSPGAFGAAEPPELIFEVRYASDAEARLLAMEQAEAIREVIEWMARRRSETGHDQAA
jgi:hypothetical protein